VKNKTWPDDNKNWNSFKMKNLSQNETDSINVRRGNNVKLAIVAGFGPLFSLAWFLLYYMIHTDLTIRLYCFTK